MSLCYRQDVRTSAEFKRDIKQRTAIERQAADSLMEMLRSAHPDGKIEDNGCDNTGEVLHRGVTRDPDFRLANCGDKTLLEMKVSRAACVTLKEDLVNSFTAYGERADVWVDWCVHFGSPQEAHYLMSPATSLKAFCGFGRYAQHNGFGNKAGWRLFRDDLDGLIAKGLPVTRYTK